MTRQAKLPKSSGVNGPEQFYLDGTEAMHRGDLKTALKILSEGLQKSPEDQSLRTAIGTVFLKMGRYEEAENALGIVLRQSPTNSPAVIGLIKLKLVTGKSADAEAIIRKAIVEGLDGPEYRKLLAQALTDLRRPEEAVIELQSIVEQDPKDTSAMLSLGLRLRDLGQLDHAMGFFSRVIELDPNNGFAYLAYVQGKKITKDDSDLLRTIKALASTQTVKEEVRVHSLYALGKAYDDLGQFREAMAFFTQANSIIDRSMSRSRPYSKERYEALLSLTKRIFTQDLIKEKQLDHHPKPTPIFIVGMFRSGTTLVEQILSSHSEVAAGGEIEHWMDESGACLNLDRETFDFVRAFATKKRYERRLAEASETAKYVTDKMPGNYRALGLLRIIYPDAKFIHCVRHPVDTCLSIYMTPFRFPPDYSSDPLKLVFTYRQYEKMMEHWKDVLGSDQILDVHYENLTNDPEFETRRLIDFCGLTWEDGCLRPEENRRAVSTASVWQARQPIYKTSLERWRNYEPWLGEFNHLLK